MAAGRQLASRRNHGGLNIETYSSLLLCACLVTGSLLAAVDPLVGKWKLNPSKSKITDMMKVEAVGPNRYALSFSPGAVETVIADGRDHPVLYGTTFSITVEGPRTWKGSRKKQGRTIVSGIWNLSEDGQTLTDDFTNYDSKGSPSTVRYVYKRTAGTSGFPGTWESVSGQMNSSFELHIQPYEGDGLSFTTPGETRSVKFDGKDHPNAGPYVISGSASSVRRVSERGLEITDKIQGKVSDTQQVELSPDGKTLTVTVQPAGQSKPNIMVFDRE